MDTGVFKVNLGGAGFSRFVVLALLATLGAGCGKIKTEANFQGLACGASDQYATYMNPMDSTRIQTVSIDSSFTSAEVKKIESAIATWNAEGRRSIGRDLFRAQVLSVSATSVPSSGSDCDFPGASGSFSVVRVANQDTWSALGFTTNNPGVTLRCSAGRGFTSKQVILLNPANMTSYTQVFESVVVHELGHAVGLDHSCDSTGSKISGFAGCSSAGTDPSYREAAMYPFVSPNNLKEDLRRNDEERATCALNYRP